MLLFDTFRLLFLFIKEHFENGPILATEVYRDEIPHLLFFIVAICTDASICIDA